MTAAIRLARPSDAAALSRLAIDTFVATFGHLYKEHDLSAFLKKNHAPEVYEKLLADPAYGIWIAEEAASFATPPAAPQDETKYAGPHPEERAQRASRRMAAGEALAYCVAGPCDLPVPHMPPNSGELARLYLDERAKGTGLAQAMLDLALDWLKARYDRIYLSVYHENVRAQRLYASRGFVKIHDYFYMVGEHADPEWIMELKEP